MADYSKADFLQRLNAPETNAPVSTLNPAADTGRDSFLAKLNAQTNQPSMFTQQPSVGDVAGRSGIDISSVPSPTTFKQRHERPGVPFDTTTGAPWQTRLKLAFAPDDATRVANLQESFKGATIEPTEGNQFIIRGVADGQGRTIDLLVDENQKGMTGKDWLDLASAVPEMIGAYAAMRSQRGRLGQLEGFKRLALEAGIGAAGGQGAGFLTDQAARANAGTMSFENAMADRSNREQGAIGETALGFGLGVLPVGDVKLAQKLVNPRTIVQEEGLAAAQRLRRETGTKVRMSFGMETGSPNALRAEAIAEKTPTGGAFVKEQAAATDEDMRAIQRYLMGDAPYTATDASGKAVETLRQVAAGKTAAVDRQTQAIASRAANDLANTIGSATGVRRSVLKSEAGNAIQDAVVKHEAAFREGAEELSQAIGGDPLIPTKAINDTLADVIKKHTSKGTRIISEQELKTGFDEFGPITTVSDTQGRAVIRELVPEGMSRFFKGLRQLDAETPLSELRALRTQINNAKKQGEIIPGVTTHILDRFSGAITEAIEAAEKTIPDPGVVQRLKAFNQYYREGISKFNPKGIVEMLADPDQLKLDPFAIVNQGKNPGQYFRIKEALTKPVMRPDGTVQSPANIGAWNLFRRALLTEIEDTARLAGTGTLADGPTLIKQLGSLEAEVINDLLGPQAADFLKHARSLGVVQGRLNIDDTIKLLRSNDPSMLELKNLAKAQDEADKLYREGVIKKFVKGEADATSIEPGEFVDRFISVARDPAEVEKVMARLSGDPALVKSIKSHTIRNFFQSAAHNPDAMDVARHLRDDPTATVNPARMLKRLQDDEQKLRAVLGNSTVDNLRDYLAVDNMRMVKDTAAKAVGGLVGSSLLSSIMTLDLKKLPAHIKYAAIGRIISDPELITYMRKAANMDPHVATQVLITSAPFIEGIMEDFGRGPGAAVLRMMGKAAGLVKDDEQVPQEAQEAQP